METTLGIVAGCAATLRPLVKAWGFGFLKTQRGGPNARNSMPKGLGWPHKPAHRSGPDSPSSNSRTMASRVVDIFHKDPDTEIDQDLTTIRKNSTRESPRFPWENDIGRDCVSPASVVHVSTSIEVTREWQLESPPPKPLMGGILQSQGANMISINGPTSKGLSEHTTW